MNKTSLFALMALATLKVTAQNSWDGSSPAISTITTNGKVAIGSATPTAGYSLSVKNLSNTQAHGFYNEITNTATGIQYGILNNPIFNGTSGTKYGLYTGVSSKSVDEAYGIYCLTPVINVANNGKRYGIVSNVISFGPLADAAVRCAIYGSVTAPLMSIKPNAHRAGFFVGSTEIISIADNNEKAFIINRRDIGVVNVGTDVFRIYGDGRVFATEINVKLATQFPDYVFASDYKLMPLTEVRDYITTHKHLPNMPTAETIANEGMNLGEMNKVVVEKLEELTLYILQQQAEIDALKQELESIKH